MRRANTYSYQNPIDVLPDLLDFYKKEFNLSASQVIEIIKFDLDRLLLLASHGNEFTYERGKSNFS